MYYIIMVWVLLRYLDLLWWWPDRDLWWVSLLVLYLWWMYRVFHCLLCSCDIICMVVIICVFPRPMCPTVMLWWPFSWWGVLDVFWT